MNLEEALDKEIQKRIEDAIFDSEKAGKPNPYDNNWDRDCLVATKKVAEDILSKVEFSDVLTDWIIYNYLSDEYGTEDNIFEKGNEK